VESLSLALEYPNGRVHECELEGEGELRLGEVFELYGRRWRMENLLAPDRRRSQPRILCVSLGPAATGYGCGPTRR
jgi:hypothetical protein